MKRSFLYLIMTFQAISFIPVECFAREFREAALSAQDSNDIFPNIKPTRPVMGLKAIKFHAKKRNLRPLAKNHMRYFVQPMGFVSKVIDIDLTTGDLIMYPSHDKGPVRETKVNADGLAELKEILTSKKFKDIPQQDTKIGFDGYTEMIEVEINDAYMWKAHWCPHDPNFIDTAARINHIFSMAWINDYIQKRGLQSLQKNQIRLIESVGKNAYVTYEIDFAASTLCYYKKDAQTEKKLDTAIINKLKQVLSSKAFQSYIDRPSRVGGDGRVIFIEADIEGAYVSNVYSVLDRDEQLKDIVSVIRKTRF